jgi:hypothetical protein
MKINTTLELYDFYIVSEIQKKHQAFNANWMFAPPMKEIGFRYAQDTFGKHKMFPLYFIFRNDPAVETKDNTSKVLYNLRNTLDEGRTLNIITVYLQYQVDFYSNNMFEMNMMNVDYFKFKRGPFVEFDFSEVSVNYKNTHEVIFENIESNHVIEEMFEQGRYFHYIYRFNLMVPIFDVNIEVPVDKIVLGVYNNQSKVYSTTIPVR